MSYINSFSNQPRVIKFRNSTTAESSEFQLTTRQAYQFTKIMIDQTNENDIDIPDAMEILQGEAEIDQKYAQFWTRSFGEISDRYQHVCNVTQKSYTDCSWAEFKNQLDNLHDQIFDELEHSGKSANIRTSLKNHNDQKYSTSMEELTDMMKDCDYKREVYGVTGVGRDDVILNYWNLEIKVCEELIQCSMPESISRSSFDIDDLGWGSEATYSCVNTSTQYYKIIGNPIKTCLSDKSWTDDDFGCFPFWKQQNYQKGSCNISNKAFCQTNYDQNGSEGIQTFTRECSAEMILNGASYGCYNEYNDDFETCKNSDPSQGSTCRYTETGCLADDCYHWENVKDSRVHSTCYAGNLWRHDDGSWNAAYGCSNNWGSSYRGGFTKFTRRCRNNANTLLLSTQANTQCDPSLLTNSGSYLRYTHYSKGLEYSSDGSNTDGVYLYVDVSQFPDMNNGSPCRVGHDKNDCTGTCKACKDFNYTHTGGCGCTTHSCNSANGYKTGKCGGGFYACHCTCCYGIGTCYGDYTDNYSDLNGEKCYRADDY